jgi:hypothetical protein
MAIAIYSARAGTRFPIRDLGAGIAQIRVAHSMSVPTRGEFEFRYNIRAKPSPFSTDHCLRYCAHGIPHFVANGRKMEFVALRMCAYLHAKSTLPFAGRVRPSNKSVAELQVCAR